jgi:hypothetical protein
MASPGNITDLIIFCIIGFLAYKLYKKQKKKDEKSFKKIKGWFYK